MRGNFGDPRTISPEGLGTDEPGDAGDYSFHNGVDISAEPGTPVFPVVSGIARVPDGDAVIVRVPLGARSFRYQHIRPVVHTGARVIAGKTVLGVVKYPARHVHLSEIDHGQVTNPATHLRPYTDDTPPVVHELAFRTPNGRQLNPDALRGPIEVTAQVEDTPSIPAPGAWAGFPVAPAVVRWVLVDSRGESVLARTVVDFRHHLPSNRQFWRIYAAGTYQNFPVFDDHYYWHLAGRYLYNLSPKPIDTRTLANGTYTLRVSASDLCENQGTLAEQIMVENS
ncbi:MAG TPA: hypothetical protein VEH79_05135 [Gaiellaceae bacterium]|nr:hypothetical protein [Gaiellaceae bacterium]